jgi:hypothetical protein
MRCQNARNIGRELEFDGLENDVRELLISLAEELTDDVSYFRSTKSI